MESCSWLQPPLSVTDRLLSHLWPANVKGGAAALRPLALPHRPWSPLRYATDDVSAGIDPNIAGGAYDTNVAGAPRTTFFMVDYDLDTLVTIAGRTAGGSSDTASGVLRTIGPVVDVLGNPFPIAPTADLDITTPAAGTNLAYLVQGQRVFCLDVSPFGPGAPLDTPQKVVATPVEASAIGNGLRSTDLGLGFIDIAVAPRR